MSWRVVHNSVLLHPTLGFIMACALLGVFSVARSMHLIEPELYQRALGQIISLMLVVIGNYLPKMRLLQGSRIERAVGGAAERFAGRTLFLAGVASLWLFISLPLSDAKLASAWLGFGTFAMIATRWMWLIYACTVRIEATPSASPRELRMAYWLMVGYGYICATAWTLNLLGDGPGHDSVRTWLVSGFSSLSSVVFPLIEGYKSPCRARARLSPE